METNNKLLNIVYSESIIDYNYEKIVVDLKDKRNILELIIRFMKFIRN